tara:strand:+ start:266 stop:487 length:222 start_codon:yes stop_codon:yes gene_type:complete
MTFVNKAVLRNPKTEVKPKVASYAEDVTEIYFDLTLIVDTKNNVTVIDNSKNDYHDWIDCNTLTYQQVKIQVC